MPELDPASHGAGPTWGLAVAGFLAGVTSLLSPWWVIRITEDGEPLSTTPFALFKPFGPVTNAWGPHVSGALVVLALFVVFIRIAGQSWAYEPGKWRRDLGAAAVLMAMALALATSWPDSLGHFWGTRTAMDSGRTYVETARAAFGWWVALVGVALLAAAAWVPPRDTTGK